MDFWQGNAWIDDVDYPVPVKTFEGFERLDEWDDVVRRYFVRRTKDGIEEYRYRGHTYRFNGFQTRGQYNAVLVNYESHEIRIYLFDYGYHEMVSKIIGSYLNTIPKWNQKRYHQ